MWLPHHDQAYVARDKIINYLLSPSHQQGRHKVPFLHALGFRSSEPETFAFALQHHARTGSLVRTIDSAYGTMYVVEGVLKGPNGRAQVRSVWIIETGSERPRLVTVFPAPLRWRPRQ